VLPMNLDTSGLDEYGGRSRFFEPNQVGLVVHLRLTSSILTTEKTDNVQIDNYVTLVGFDQFPSRARYLFCRADTLMLKPGGASVRNMRHIVPLGLDVTWRLITVSTLRSAGLKIRPTQMGVAHPETTNLQGVRPSPEELRFCGSRIKPWRSGGLVFV
jgi:hypothetical protein